MPRDFDLIIHEFPERPDLHIHFIADVHLGAQEHMAKNWEYFCGHVLDDPNAYLIIGGDMINNATRNSVSNIFDETMRPREQKRIMAEMLKPLRNRILCALPGNHEGRSGKDADDDPMYDIMCKLDLEDLYRENLAFIKIQMGRKDSDGQKNPTYTLAATHGAGGGIYTGAAVNRNERFGYVIDGCDALLVAHSHKPFVTQPGKIYIDRSNNKVSIKPFKVIVATSWLEYSGYAARKQLLPASHCPQVITLYGHKKAITVTM
jgi:hypothetical protein